jgi:hypothetical protein
VDNIFPLFHPDLDLLLQKRRGELFRKKIDEGAGFRFRGKKVHLIRPRIPMEIIAGCPFEGFGGVVVRSVLPHDAGAEQTSVIGSQPLC